MDQIQGPPIQILFTRPVIGIVILLVFALTISVHEAAHAWVAEKLGDDTAKQQGRTSLNPFAHIDPIGGLLFLFTWFGWAKPVPVNEHRLRRNLDIILVALAGPASNFIFAAVVALALRNLPVGPYSDVLYFFVLVNVALMVFNLIPIPPLDGSKLLRLVIPAEWYYNLERYGFILILALLFLIRSGSFQLTTLLSNAMGAIINFLL